jgi:hypothetical protein
MALWLIEQDIHLHAVMLIQAQAQVYLTFILQLSCTVEKRRKRRLYLPENDDKLYVQFLEKYRKVFRKNFHDISEHSRMLQNILNASLSVYTLRTPPKF